MTAVMEHPIGPYSVQDWLALDPPVDGSRLELILGHLHMTPAPSGEHQRAAFRLARLVEDAVDAASRDDLHVVPAVNVRISTPWRTALIPDVVVLNTPPRGTSFPAEALALAVEIWSPGNPKAERETKQTAYAAAGVPFLWTIVQGRLRNPILTALRLDGGRYIEECVVTAGMPATIDAGPVPVRIDPATLLR
ncbi:Uma2 family endonuclease [Actinoalloteichus hymeniacidonis]|uniref:Restriction endonuclease n=1 Tax=Actinoalloteichus hymeniacidonis TaxID=340345 RepID=A0AAC9HNR8_9PSEU|nr:Uma2 family endonuclease [Actinoalloteichus hymeniacidonis]AOS62613.1 Putative restriction endonuclease [Actinoalloteichus hymeniacidonis]MBB5909355.1 Uma2 family endonuclease [Actinoalloteichus hymeniacidonis]